MAKPKISSDWMAGCADCHMSLLDMDERIVQVAELAVEQHARAQVEAQPGEVSFGNVKKGTEDTREILVNDLNPGRRHEVGNRHSGRGALHEFRPDRQGRLRARKTKLRLVIETHPDDGQ